MTQSKKGKMIPFYRQVLATAGCVVTDDDCVSYKAGDEKLKPLLVKGKRLVLPTQMQLSRADWENCIAFHPLSEDTRPGESPVLERLRMMLVSQLNTTITLLATQLLSLAASKDQHALLDAEQEEILPLLKNATQKTFDLFVKKIVPQAFQAPNHQFVSMYLRRSAKLGNESFFRAGIAYFPFYEDLKKGEEKVFGVKIDSKRERETLLALFDYILPHQDEKNYYSRGSDSDIGPSLDAILKTFKKIADPLNDVVARFAKFVGDDLMIPMDWADSLENLNQFLPDIRDVPMLSGNAGEEEQASAVPAAAAAVPTARPAVPSAPSAGTVPVAPRPAAPARSAGARSVADAMRDLGMYAPTPQPGMVPGMMPAAPAMPQRASMTNPTAGYAYLAPMPGAVPGYAQPVHPGYAQPVSTTVMPGSNPYTAI